MSVHNILAMMEGRVIEYRPLGGGLDYHNSPLIGEIPTNDLYHSHRSIDQLRSLNERGALSNGHHAPNSTELKVSTILHLDYKHYNNNTGEIRTHQEHPHHNQHHHLAHHPHQPHPHHDAVDYLKHVGHVVEMNGGSTGDGNGGVVVSDGSVLIEEQTDKMDVVLKQVEKQEVDSVYHPSTSVTPSPPLSSPSESIEHVVRGRKKVPN